MSKESDLVENGDLVPGRWDRFVPVIGRCAQFVVVTANTSHGRVEYSMRIESSKLGEPIDIFLLSTKFHKVRVHSENGANTARMLECIAGETVGFLVVSDPYNPLCEFPKFNGVFCHLNEDE